MVEKLCVVDLCEQPSRARGWCNTHYSRWRVHGDPTQAKFRAKSFKDALEHYTEWVGDCLIWTGFRNSDGYGVVRYCGPMIGAHRAVWLESQGPVPRGLKIDHRCHTPACVNIEHLRLVTHKQNMENYKGERVDNASGFQGVNYSKDSKKWVARVQHNGTREFLGYFDSAEEAGRVAKERRLELFTHNERDKSTIG